MGQSWRTSRSRIVTMSVWVDAGETMRVSRGYLFLLRLSHHGEAKGSKMKYRFSILWAMAAVTFLAVGSGVLLAQDSPMSLTGDQQSAAKSALCSAIASKFPNPATAGPSALSDPSVLSTAASSFAGSTKIPLPSATDMIKTYAMQHATDILGSCAAGSATGGLTSQIPGGSGLPSMPSVPKMPY
jgi:hypothetical protein